MTPLAHELAKQLILPAGRRDPFWATNYTLLSFYLNNTHFFEVTAVQVLLPQLSVLFANQNKFASALEVAAFLPATKTWIEMNTPRGRVGLFIGLDDTRQGGWARVDAVFINAVVAIGHIALHSDDIDARAGVHVVPDIWSNLFNGDITLFQLALLSQTHINLLLINSPGIVGRRAHTAHKTLSKSMAKAQGPTFKVNGWNEIKLELSAPAPVGGTSVTVSGKRALHFCRKHIRITRGRLGYVSGHWRGDASKGIRHSRYSVTP